MALRTNDLLDGIICSWIIIVYILIIALWNVLNDQISECSNVIKLNNCFNKKKRKLGINIKFLVELFESE